MTGAPPGLFVTGTDTGVGKTTVGVGLARLALRRGRRPIPYKPVETGCDPEPGDARRLWEAARPPTTLKDTCPFPLPLPAAPAAAAAAAGVRLNFEELVRRGRDAQSRGDFFLVEGAGGLLVPYVDGRTNADLAGAFGLPVLLVARTALGTVNHTALTLAALERLELRLAGVVLVRTLADAGPHEATNPDLIESVTGRRPIATVPFLSSSELDDADRIADAVGDALPPAWLEAWLEGSG
jgi:dethiobiotin synthetase